MCGVSPRASFLPALPWGHDPSPAGDLASPHSQSPPGVSRLGVGTDRRREHRAGGVKWEKRDSSAPPTHPHLGSECGPQGDGDSDGGALRRGRGSAS